MLSRFQSNRSRKDDWIDRASHYLQSTPVVFKDVRVTLGGTKCFGNQVGKLLTLCLPDFNVFGEFAFEFKLYSTSIAMGIIDYVAVEVQERFPGTVAGGVE